MSKKDKKRSCSIPFFFGVVNTIVWLFREGENVCFSVMFGYFIPFPRNAANVLNADGSHT